LKVGQQLDWSFEMCSDASGSGKNELVEVVRRTKVVGVSGVVDDKYIE
jgi:hypothetical protein